MRVPLSWLREFAPVPEDPAEVAAALDQLGLVVEALERPGAEIEGVVVARVLGVRPHPNADRLTLVDVDHGGGQTTVVCGARNLESGDVVPYASAGVTLPGGLTLERRTIRGERSDGMLCSEQELALGEDHAGILKLDAAAEIGSDVRDALGLHDAVFELEVTPNRSDAMSVVGVARDLAAHFAVPLTVPEPSVTEAGAPTDEVASVVVEAADRCPRFTARLIDVTPGPSPEWLARRLTLAGMRPISNIVDVTNYVMLERGQPLHAFDHALLPGGGIVVRLAAEGERLTTLDGTERELTDDDLLICGADRSAQAIAGVMGGGATEVSESTTRILLEAAYFDPAGIAHSAKRLGLRSEASARFERGIDPNGVLVGSARAAELLAEVAGGRAAPDPIDAYPDPVERPRIRLRVERVNEVLGTALSESQVRDAIEPLGIDVSGGPGDLETRAPTFRPDLEREIDLVEEVARHVGYNAIQRTVPRSTEQAGSLTRRQRDRRLVADALVGAGLDEANTLTFVAPADLEALGLSGDGVEVENPLRADESLLRPRLLPGLLGAAGFNAAQGRSDVGLFEIGHVFAPPPSGQTLPDEREAVAAVLTGTVRTGPHAADRPADAYDAVDLWETVATALSLAQATLEPGAEPGFRDGRLARVSVDGRLVGVVGELDDRVAEHFSAARPAVGFEVDLGAVLSATRRIRRFQPFSRFPASAIDLAFVVGEDVPAAAIVRTIDSAGDGLVESARCFDEFRSPALGSGRRSLAFAVSLRAPDRTLTDGEVGEVRRRLIDAVREAHGAELRG